MTDWLNSLRDKRAQAKVRIRIKRIEAGAFGDAEPKWAKACSNCASSLGAGPNIASTTARHGQTVVILLCGGAKKTQPARHQDRQGILG